MDPHQSTQKLDPARILSQAFSYVKHLRLMLIVFSMAILAGTAYFLYATPLYSAKSLVHFQSYGATVRDAELPETGNYNSGVTLALLDRLKSQEIQIAAARKLGLLGEVATYEDFLDYIPSVVINVVDSRNFEVTVLAYDPEVVRNFCAALVDEFQRIQEESWRRFRDGALERYAVQLKELEEKVAENTTALTDLERDQHFTQMTIEQQSLLEIPKDIVETKERLKRMEAVRATLVKLESENGNSENTIAILSLLSNFEEDTKVEVGNLVQRSLSPGRSPVGLAKESGVQVVTPGDVEGIEPWRELERKKRVTETQIQEASAIFLPEHPKMKELQEELELLNRSLLSEMSVLREKFDLEYSRLTERLAQLETRIPEYQKVTEEFGKSSQQFSAIEQAQTMWDDARKRLAAKLATITFTDDFDWVEMTFKEHTSLRDKVPISPNKRKLVMLSLLLGVAAAIGLPTVLNLLDTSATSLAQLEDYIGIKGIGIVPLSDPEFLESVHRSPAQGSTVPNFILECFRVIRANIGLDATFEGHQSQVILVTSARPQEGKTTQAANLAWAYRSIGEKVLLVDCDLRRGRQHALLRLDNSGGMSRMLMGELSPAEAVLSIAPGSFQAVPRGPIIPGSTELLCQEGFSKLVQQWRGHYDRIILDCPPVLGLSESTSLQRLADGVVLVVRSEKTSMKDVRDAVTILRKTGARFFGFVLNGVDLSKVGNYYQYYYYSAPYYDQFEEDPVEASAPSLPVSTTAEPAEAPAQPRERPRKDDSTRVSASPPPPPLPTGPSPTVSDEASRALPPRTRPASQAERIANSLPGRRASSSRNPARTSPTDWSESETDQSWQQLQREKLRQEQESEWQQPLERRPLPRRPTSAPGNEPQV